MAAKSTYKEYKHKDTESKWQKAWLKEKVYSPDLKSAKKPFYNLMMFPYPSGEGLHVGNMYAFTGADIYGRWKRMMGYDVFEPIGLDGFGIHSENYAIKVSRHPKEHAKISEKHFYEQLHMIGDAYDWTRTLETYDPDYYKWTQWLFIQIFKAGLAYKGSASVNWCPTDKTVLADEQVIDGCCERCGTRVERREMSSWFFKITKYADRLLENIEKINWPEKIKTAQRNWIGKSSGMIIKFKILNSKTEIEVFTTRPDTLNAVTFLATSKLYEEGSKEKKGKFSGKYAIDPLSGRRLPVWDTNYVAPGYGTGIVMGVPAHDERDMEFAKKYHLDIIKKEPDDSLWEKVEKEGWGKRYTNYHLRDWLISRQRYWGPPIPMIYCKSCASAGKSWEFPISNGSTSSPSRAKSRDFQFPISESMAGWFPVPEEDLPVLLPDIKDFKPKGDGTSPLHNAPESWKKVKCPKCGEMAERELDVSDTFLDSSWYFLAYPNLDTKEWKGLPSAKLGPFNKEIIKKWFPVDAYIGGAEHAVLHLLYARFVTMVLKDLGYLDFEEPFPFLFGHGLIIKDGAKMSKSKGNIVNPDEYINKFGADALRMYLMFLGPYDQGGDFRDTGIEGMNRFLNRIWKLFDEKPRDGVDEEVNIKVHQTIRKVTQDIENFKYNTAISAIMELVNVLREKGADKNALVVLCKLLAPLTPHIAEEMWVNLLGQKFTIHTSEWPKHDVDLAKETTNVIVIQVNGKLRGSITVDSKQSKSKEEITKTAQEDVKVAKQLKGKKIKNVIFVPGKVINFVTF